MNFQKSIIMSFFILLLCFPGFAYSIPAFPGAQGMGANSLGGRGGEVIKVTNLNDSGPGSFRAAVESSGPRIIVFTVSGYINLDTLIVIRNPYLTIAGQSSPGGIGITGRPVRLLTHDVIITHMRFRLGSHRCSSDGTCETQGESLFIGNGYNIIIDHSSLSWGTDEVLQVGSYWGDVYGVTISWSMIYEGLQDPHPKDNHGYGLLVSSKFAEGDGPKITIHHSYLAHHSDRMPQINGDVFVDFRNNVGYNWKGALSIHIYNVDTYNPEVNVVDNYYKPGANSNTCYPGGNTGEISAVFSGTPREQIFVEGNLGCIRDDQQDDEWSVVQQWSGSLLNEGWKKTTPYATTGIPVTTRDMSYSYAQEILQNVGATKPVRDSADTEVINEFSAGTGGFVTNVTYPDDYPTLSSPSPPSDIDNDGMADSWETVRGLNVGLNDSAGDNDNDGYTNIEEYLYYYLLGIIKPPLNFRSISIE